MARQDRRCDSTALQGLTRSVFLPPSAATRGAGPPLTLGGKITSMLPRLVRSARTFALDFRPYTKVEIGRTADALLFPIVTPREAASGPGARHGL
jgi:hypothetical protein